MSLTSSLWTSVSGLINHGEKMNVIGNNIANINTVGFKGQRMDFQDFVYQNVGSANGTAQVGRGVSIGAIMGDFSTGAFETSTEVTDMAISGKGFFSVVPKGSENAYYTRAGNFRFDKDGYLTDPHGYVLQGWPVNSADDTFGTAAAATALTNPFRGSGVSGDIKLDNFSVPPRHTNNVTFQVQLNRTSESNSVSNSTDATLDGTVVFSGATPPVPTTFIIGGTSYVINNPVMVGTTPAQLQEFEIEVAGQTTTITLDNLLTPASGASSAVTVTSSGPVASIHHNTTAVLNYGNSGYTSITVNGETYPVTAATATTITATIDGNPIDINGTFVVPAPTVVPPATTGSTAPITVDFDLPTTNSDPFFGLFQNWNGTMTGTNQTPLAGGQFAYSTNLKVYDEGGTAHVLTVYFDKVKNSEVNGAINGQEYWEYIVTIDPAQDNRTFETPPGSGTFLSVAGTRQAGLLMSGTITFDTSGQMLDTTAFTPDANTTATNIGNLSSWTPAQFSPNGLPLFAANFSGRDGMSYANPNNAASLSYMTELNLGLANTSGSWNLPAGVTNASNLGNNIQNVPSMSNMNNPVRRAANASTGNGAASSTISQKQDGYSFGFLSTVSVSADGVLSGRYSNGIVKELYQLTIYDFVSQQNLRREGGNLFSQTLESGDPAPGIANNNGNGSVNSNSLEQSNVDMSREFTQMITTQRGFQANSKGITTVDTMLEVVINMKR